MVIIIGAGLSGLLTAYRLKKEGVPFKILEARDRIGGRIHTVYDTNQTPVEMGATWFNDQHQYLKTLIKELNIDYFEQYMEGSAFYQPLATSPAHLIQIPSQAPSYRISCGSTHLINTLYESLDENEVLLNHSVTEILFQNNRFQVVADEIYEADKVVLALPPKLWANRIVFKPQLPIDLKTIATQTQTWMEDSIKIALTYTEPFWAQNQVSGTLFSNVGPITELYDHCNEERTKYALCGFIHPNFKNLLYKERKARVIIQLKDVFGLKAEEFINYEECLWSHELNTFEATENFLFPHQNNGNQIFSKTFYNDALFISGSESALVSPGYMDGAVYAAELTAERIIKSHPRN